MQISIEATWQDILPAFDWIGGLIGEVLDKRVVAFRQQEQSSPILFRYLSETYALEFALAAARAHHSRTGQLPRTVDFAGLFGFLITAHRIRRVLPDDAIKPFEGQLAKAAGDPSGLRPFAYEIAIATHLMGKGWDVEFTDYTGISRFDFLARKEAVEFEVECKATSHDLGRKIHRQDATRLSDLILPATLRLQEAPGCHLVRITVPDRLGSSNAELFGITNLVTQVVESGASMTCELASIEYTATDLRSWPEPGDDGFQAFFREQIGHSNPHLMVSGSPGRSIVAVAIVSAKADDIIKGIGNQAKKAADQCSGTRPAMLAINLADELSRAELDDLLNTSSGLQKIVGKVFNSEKRAHVDTVAFTVPQRATSAGQGALVMSGDVVAFYSPRPKFECVDIRTVFKRT